MSDLPSFPGPSLYLFAGSDTTTQPVDLSTYVAADRDSADTSHCKSNGTVASVAISAGRTIRYGIKAVNGVFEQTMRAVSSVANATGTPDIETLQSIYGFASTELDAAPGLQGLLSVQVSSLSEATSAQATLQDTTSDLIT